jgi:aminoglycoside phosphotransferase (APT) family kinase protein
MDKGLLIGQGRTAEVFAWGEGRALKLYHAGRPVSAAEAEYRNAQAVYKSGAAAPAVDGVIQVDGRYGVIYERVDGPSLLSRTTMQPWTIFASARLMAELHARMHTHHVPSLPEQRARLRQRIQAADPLSSPLKQTALQALAQLPDDTALCHGDFHPDNIVLSTRWPVILDWVDATSGQPLADVARTALLMQQATLPPGTPRRWLLEAARTLWYQLYLRRYCRLRAVSPAQVQAWLLPVAAARLSENIPEEVESLLRLIKRLAVKVCV